MWDAMPNACDNVIGNVSRWDAIPQLTAPWHTRHLGYQLVVSPQPLGLATALARSRLQVGVVEGASAEIGRQRVACGYMSRQAAVMPSRWWWWWW